MRQAASLVIVSLCILLNSSYATSGSLQEMLFNPGHLRPVDSTLKVAIGEVAPDFALRSTTGDIVTLSQFRGTKKVVLSFIPAAWTPVCSDQWPGYNISKKIFTEHNAILLGIAVDNLPTLHAWTTQMNGLWFPVLSDFWPHGRVADAYGVLRGDGTAERALVFIDMTGRVQGITVADINVRPLLEDLVRILASMP